MAPFLRIFAIIISITVSVAVAQAQAQAPPPAAAVVCNGVFLSYTYTTGSIIPPILSTANQPYRFVSTLTVVNNALEELKSWQVSVGFRHNELLVSASNAVLADGTSLPAMVGNGTVFAGYPSTDLKTAVETAGDLTQMTAQIDLLGTQFGVAAPNVPMPSNISLVNDGFVCTRPTMQGRSQMQVCCTRDSNFESNITLAEEFLPRRDGDLTIMYDVTRTYNTDYWAQVTISNHNPLGRLDDWRLSWDWMRDEFIFATRGAYPSVRDSSACIFGPQGEYYQGMDFSTILNCERRPTIMDLPLTRANDTDLGMIPFCCRNGTILPRTMDPSKSTSVFQIHVFKMPPDLNRSQLSPPQNWNISGRLNPDYECGPPVRVSPSLFPDPSGLPSDSTAIASWQVVCNITQHIGASPRCCVSFSAYYNESIIPCETCACGCPNNNARSCSTTAPALFLPSQALLVPFENRTRMAAAWAELKHRVVPNPLPCGDNCGVSLNWHLFTDYSGGWSARMTIFNWDDTAFVDWFAAVEMNKTALGFEAAYSFNGSVLEGVNNTIFMQGLEGLNYLVAETDAANPQRDPRVPGKQQSVISFTKRNTPGIDIVAGDGFPTKVFFNGEECSLPRVLPSNNSHRLDSSLTFSVLLAAVVLILMQR